MGNLSPLRIYLIWQHPLLRDTVKAILNQETFVLVGDSQELPPLEEIKEADPDVVLFEQGDCQSEQLTPYLSILNRARLVCISLVDNKLFIYHREERILLQAADLVTALQQK